MGRRRNRWVRWMVVWTLASISVAVFVAVQAMASLADAWQACFYQSVPCPPGDEPSVWRLTFAFFGVPAIWLAGIVIAAVGGALKRRGDQFPR